MMVSFTHNVNSEVNIANKISCVHRTKISWHFWDGDIETVWLI